LANVRKTETSRDDSATQREEFGFSRTVAARRDPELLGVARLIARWVTVVMIPDCVNCVGCSKAVSAVRKAFVNADHVRISVTRIALHICTMIPIAVTELAVKLVLTVLRNDGAVIAHHESAVVLSRTTLVVLGDVLSTDSCRCTDQHYKSL
jgi:hypothetical protein